MFKAFRSRVQRWVNQRIPRADQRVFGQRNIFILPTGAGMVFAALLLIMLITGINYQNSLIYLLTFLLGAVVVAAMHQTHRNLSGLELTLIQAGDGFAGDTIPFRLRAVSPRHDSLAISLFCDDNQLENQHVPAGQQEDMTLAIPSCQRGYLQPERIRVETRFPFGLFKAGPGCARSRPALSTQARWLHRMWPARFRMGRKNRKPARRMATTMRTFGPGGKGI